MYTVNGEYPISNKSVKRVLRSNSPTVHSFHWTDLLMAIEAAPQKKKPPTTDDYDKNRICDEIYV